MNRYCQSFILYISFFFSIVACGNEHNNEKQNEPEQPLETISTITRSATQESVLTGAEVLISDHLDLLNNKSVGIVANHTSMINHTHLVDTLLALGINVTKVFAPEHGFRGAADAGAKISNSIDPQTGLPILSLYGNTRKPSESQLSALDIILFDIQDVGTRHYTYISTMSYVMEAGAEEGIPVIVLDRPNPNGWYVDGPMMNPSYQSFIGMHEVPVVHGLTIGEYAQMVNGEFWLKDSVQANLTVIPCKGYTHTMTWEETGIPWIAPSPNLATEYAAYLYPALCWFEPTAFSIGRGTDEAFTILGAPWVVPTSQARIDQPDEHFFGLTCVPYSFIPKSLPGKSTYPKFQDQTCQGYKFTNRVQGKQLFLASLKLLQVMARQTNQYAPDKTFFQRSFETWAGNTELEKQIKSNMNPEEIWLSWQDDVNIFRNVRKQYLLYKDFD